MFVCLCTPVKTLKPFKSDGCSVFPDRSLINEDDWCECCLEHDKAYWQGGTKEQRDSTDQVFRNCILEKTQDTALANLMYTGVRIGGSPYFPTWYRWGYGWPYQRGYKPLTLSEKQMVEERLKEYFNGNLRVNDKN